MKQILQNLKTGKTEVVDVPNPRMKTRHLLVQTRASLISAGTERILIDFGKAGYIQKAKQQPDKVRQVINKIRTDGFMPSIEVVRAKLDQPLALGYCNVGIIQEFGNSGVEEFQVGDRVVSNGPHAEMVCVPKNLCAKIPNGVSDEEAVFAIPGAIALQGVRLSQPTIGEFFVVIGLGLIGLLAIQILLANGCQVMGVDLDSDKCRLAQTFGAEAVDISAGEDSVEAALSYTSGRGVDGVLITAATKSSEPVHQAAQMCRKRGRIVLVGVTGLELRRSDFYEKELSFQVSCSYGPGRYDQEYEEKGHDYPIGFVRWTEQRNFEAILELIAAEKLNMKPLVSHRFPLKKAEKAYELIAENKEPYLGIIFEYGTGDEHGSVQQHTADKVNIDVYPRVSMVDSQLVVGFIGAGNFAGQVLLPALMHAHVRLKTIASSGGVSGTHLAKKFGFAESTTAAENIFDDPDINTVFIATHHNTHASFLIQALKSGKHVFVEKPLCINQQQLDEIIDTYSAMHNKQAKMPIVMVGFNRRFAPHIEKMQELIDAVKEPKSIVMTINAGKIPSNHWTQDPEVGGGRIIGEVCHFVDLLRFLIGCEISDSHAFQIKSGVGDTLSIMLSFVDGSIGTVHYFANGHRTFPKERLEVFCSNRILVLDNYKRMRGYGWKGFKKMNLWKQDKGHVNEIRLFIKAVRGETPPPISFAEIVETTDLTLQIANAPAKGLKD